MPKISTDANLYLPHTKGKYIYKHPQRYNKWNASFSHKGCSKSATFYSAEEARLWVDEQIARLDIIAPLFGLADPA
jgi:hypothetical protein